MNEEKDAPIEEQSGKPLNEEKDTPFEERSGAVEQSADIGVEPFAPTKREIFKMILGGYLGMLPMLLAILAAILVVYLIVRFAWGG